MKRKFLLKHVITNCVKIRVLQILISSAPGRSHVRAGVRRRPVGSAPRGGGGGGRGDGGEGARKALLGGRQRGGEGVRREPQGQGEDDGRQEVQRRARYFTRQKETDTELQTRFCDI